MMNNYGMYIWSCYSIFILLITYYVFAALKRSVAIHKELKKKFLAENSSASQT